MKKNKKHAAPLRCRLAVRRREPNPAGFVICEIGAGECRRCEGCEHYNPDKLRDVIIEAADRLKARVHEFAETFDALKLSLPVSPKQSRKPAEKEEDTQP